MFGTCFNLAKQVLIFYQRNLREIPNKTHLASTSLEVLKKLGANPIPGVEERYTVSYSFEGEPQPQFDDLFEFSVPTAGNTGSWTATMVYHTTEVRYDPNNLLTFTYDFFVGDGMPASN